ncbi:MAG: thiol reductant ABC exporter subunit CydD [Leptolinea sp.]|jgi:ATP-binding cassette subfamily C protein CydD|nr:thiol reductant ABC exporter subunit CydD [Leptolinea sp.]
MPEQRRLIRLSFDSLFPLIGVIGSALLIGGLIILQAWLLSHILDHVHLHAAGLEQVTPDLIRLAIVVLLRAFLVFVNEQSAAVLSAGIRSRLRESLTVKVLRLGPAYTEQQQAGELTYALTGAIDSLDAYFSQYVPQLVIAAVLPVAILAVVFPIDTLSGVIFVLTAPLIPIFMVLIGRTTETLTRRQYQTFSRMSAFFLDSLRGLVELKNLGKSAGHSARLDTVGERYRSATLRVLRVSFLSALVLELAATLSVAVIAVEIGIRLLYRQMDFQQAFFLLVIAPDFYLPLRQLGARFHAAQNGVSAARRIFEIFDQPEQDEESAQEKAEPFEERLFCSPFTIRFNDVSFTYPGREQEAVSHVAFTLTSGQTTAIVGLNGSGKTTLASLLLRFIQPEGGTIFYNDTDIQNIPLDRWRSGIAFLDQRPVVFNTTLRENLLLVRPDATSDQLRSALETVHLQETINSLPRGLDTGLGEEGYILSGGQIQRLAIARLFLKDAPLLILDEPTSHLDPFLENELDVALELMRKNRTCLVIAHRKSTARQADRVLFMENGRLAAAGRHADLLAEVPHYASLFGPEGKV